MDNLSKFDERLKELLFDSELTIQQLADVLGISKGNISHWTNKKQSLSLLNALKIAEFFSCSLEFLVGRSNVKLDFLPKKCPPFYDRLLFIMHKAGKSRYRIVRETNFSDGNFYAWKKGATPNMQTVSDLADYFDVTIDYLVGRE